MQWLWQLSIDDDIVVTDDGGDNNDDWIKNLDAPRLRGLVKKKLNRARDTVSVAVQIKIVITRAHPPSKTSSQNIAARVKPEDLVKVFGSEHWSQNRLQVYLVVNDVEEIARGGGYLGDRHGCVVRIYITLWGITSGFS